MYVGTYKGGMKNGEGEYYWPSGNFYKGMFLNDKRHGFGVMNWKDGTVYKGAWRQGV